MNHISTEQNNNPSAETNIPAQNRAADLEWDGLAQHGAIAACLPHLLSALGWPGTARTLAEAVPLDNIGLNEVRDIMARLGYTSIVTHIRNIDGFPAGLPERPSLFLSDHGEALTVLQATDQGLLVRDAGQSTERIEPYPGSGTLVQFFPLLEADTTPATQEKSWFRARLKTLRPLVVVALVLTFIANLLAMANPLFVMAVYDKVIASGSMITLLSISSGAVMAILMELYIRRLRSGTMAYAGARLSYVVGNTIFGRLLSLPSQMTERAPIGTQVARVRDLERVRDLLTGPIALSCLDLPFTVIFIAGVFAIGGWLGLVPLAAVLVYGLCAIVARQIVQSRVTATAQASARRQELVLEIIEKMRPLKASGAGAIWLERYRDLSVKTSEAGFANTQLATLITTCSQALTMGSGLLTLVFGIHLVLAGTMTTGALIASMMMVWRILNPLQGTFVAITRLSQIRASVRQIDALMSTPGERSESLTPTVPLGLKGQIAFNHVTFRYGREADPILSNISFEIKAGEVIGIVGRNGTGKSSVLKLIAGLYSPQMGSIHIDGQDIRQFDPIELRQSIAYVPQTPQLFSGSIADNLSMSSPLASEADMFSALDKAGALDAVRVLPEGLNTQIDTHAMPLPANLLARISLARAYLKKAPIILLDEPLNGADFEGEFAFMTTLEQLRQHSTVFFVTHRRGHLSIADKVLILEGGAVRYFGAADKVRNQIPRGMI